MENLKNRIKLDLGCGDVKQGEDWISIDISPNSVADYVWDLTKIPYPKEWALDNKFDEIRADNIFEHFTHDEYIKVLQECHRILKPNGVLWIRVPNALIDFEKAIIDPTHKHLFGPGTFDYCDIDCPNKRWQHYGQMYGIPKFKRIRQVDNWEGRGFIICEIQAIK